MTQRILVQPGRLINEKKSRWWTLGAMRMQELTKTLTDAERETVAQALALLQVRRGRRRGIDEPHGRRHRRTGGDGRARDNDRALKVDSSLLQLPAFARAKLASALGSGAVPNGHASPHVVHALHHAFVSALAAGLEVSAAVAFAGALLALRLIGPVRTQPAETRPIEQPAPEAVTA